MKTLVDTDWVINYLKGRAETIRVMQSLAADGLGISLITYARYVKASTAAPIPRDTRHPSNSFCAV